MIKQIVGFNHSRIASACHLILDPFKRSLMDNYANNTYPLRAPQQPNDGPIHCSHLDYAAANTVGYSTSIWSVSRLCPC